MTMNIKSNHPLKRQTAADELYTILKRDIASGSLKTGDKLPTQEELCSSYQISRSTVREAISKLQAIGLVSSRPGKGTTVNSQEAGKQMLSLSASILLDSASVSEFLQARFVVERAVIRLIGVLGKPEDFKKLQAHIKLQESAYQRKDIVEFGKLDVEFHSILAKLSHNSVLATFLENISDSLSTFISAVTELEGAAKSALEYHKCIVEALSKGDTQQAEQFMADHLFNVGKRIEKNTGDLCHTEILKTLM